ncbi:MAG: hypothetical protein C0402_15525 [Thermodesulfovibrio sp.]|nr:hypothetical protein [Thermodesulfovibrio sp.]
MGLEAAIGKAWDNLLHSGLPNSTSVRFLADEYVIDVKNRQVLSLSGNAPAEDYLTVLILHYIARKIAGLPALTGDLLGFSGLSAAGSFAEEFKKRSTDLILRKYGNNPAGMLSVLDRVPGKKINQSDAAIVLEAFEGVPILIELWRADEEFGPEANLLFDKSITQIFCTEDIVVLAEAVAIAISQEV